MAFERLSHIIGSKGPQITDKNVWNLWKNGAITNQAFANYINSRGVAKVTRNWGSGVLHIKLWDSKNIQPPEKALAMFDIDGANRDAIIRFDLLIPELEKLKIKIGKEEGLRDAPKSRQRMTIAGIFTRKHS